MAALNAADRLAVLYAYIRKVHVEQGALARFDTTTLATCVGNIDDWFESNLADLNAAFPAGFRTNASLQEKALIVAYVTLKKGGVI